MGQVQLEGSVPSIFGRWVLAVFMEKVLGTVPSCPAFQSELDKAKNILV